MHTDFNQINKIVAQSMQVYQIAIR